MIKELFFKANLQIPAHILIDDGKIKEYIGHNVVDIMVLGDAYKTDISTFCIDANFSLVKISKYDINKFGVKGNYMVVCNEITQFTILSDGFIKLNRFEKMQIDYMQKKLWIQNSDHFKWTIGIIIAIILACVGWRLSWVLSQLPKH